MTIPCCTYLMHFSFILHVCMASLNGWLPLSQWKRFSDSLNNHLRISVGWKCLLFTLPGFIYIVFTLLDFMLLSFFFLYTRKVVSDRVLNKLYEEKVLYLNIKKVLYFFSFFHSRKFVSYRVPKKLYYSLDSGVSLLSCGRWKSNQKHDCRVFTDDKRHMQTTQFKGEREKNHISLFIHLSAGILHGRIKTLEWLTWHGLQACYSSPIGTFKLTKTT